MSTPTPATTREMMESLASKLCPSCGQNKRPHAVFCARDYFALPTHMQKDLYKRAGSGYEQAVIAAIEFLARKRAEQQPKLQRSIAPEDRA